MTWRAGRPSGQARGPLSELRAEVERLRNEARRSPFRAYGAASMATRVLDLIDKAGPAPTDEHRDELAGLIEQAIFGPHHERHAVESGLRAAGAVMAAGWMHQ